MDAGSWSNRQVDSQIANPPPLIFKISLALCRGGLESTKLLVKFHCLCLSFYFDYSSIMFPLPSLLQSTLRLSIQKYMDLILMNYTSPAGIRLFFGRSNHFSLFCQIINMISFSNHFYSFWLQSSHFPIFSVCFVMVVFSAMPFIIFIYFVCSVMAVTQSMDICKPL